MGRSITSITSNKCHSENRKNTSFIRGKAIISCQSSRIPYGTLYLNEEFLSLGSQIKGVVLQEYHFRTGNTQFINDIPDSTFFEAPDIVITYNDQLLNEFSYSLDPTPTDKYDFVSVVLRDLARGFGLYCNIAARNNNIIYVNEYPTRFEERVRSYLNSKPDSIYSLATQGSIPVYIPYLNGYNLRLYAPNQWIPGVSLNTFISNPDVPLTELLSYEFGKGTVIRDVSTPDIASLFKWGLGWEVAETVSIGPTGGCSTTGSTENLVAYGDTDIPVSDLSISPYTTNLTATNFQIMPRLETSDTDSYSFDYTNYLWKYHFAYNPEYTLDQIYRKYQFLTVGILKKDGTWDIVYKVPMDLMILQINTSDFNYNYPLDQYARTADGYLRCRINGIFTGSYLGQYYSYSRARFYVVDCLPQKIEMAYSGLSTASESPLALSDYDDYLRQVNIGIKNLEGTDRIVVEQLNEGDRLPIRFEVSDFKKGYFTATVDKEFYSQFTIIAYNKNGSTRSESFELPPLEPYVEEVDLKMTSEGLKAMPTKTLRASDFIINFEINKADLNSQGFSIVKKGAIHTNESIAISDLPKGLYIISYSTRSGDRKQMKFSIQ